MVYKAIWYFNIYIYIYKHLEHAYTSQQVTVFKRCMWLLTSAILTSTPRDTLEVSLDLVTRFRAKRFKEAIKRLLQDIWDNVDFKRISNNEEQALINLIHV